VNFFLPSYIQCGKYALTNPTDWEIFLIHNSTSAVIKGSYVNRSTHRALENGTVVFTLWHLSASDFGFYQLRKGKYLMQEPGCDIYFELKELRDSKFNRRFVYV